MASAGGSGEVSRKDMEKRAVELMINGQSPQDAMKESGCNYKVGGRDYGRVYKRFTRRKKRKGKKKVTAMQLVSQAEKESTAFKLMTEQKIRPADAMTEAGFLACLARCSCSLD